MNTCSSCATPLDITELRCARCEVGFRGRFALPRLARLAPEHQRLAEALLLAGGNLKQVAKTIDISYPTLRRRLDDMIAAIATLRREDEVRAQALLDEVEAGRTAPEAAARLIREMNGEP